MDTPFFFVRHGESEANTGQVIANRPEDGYPLTAAGVIQAQAAGERLAAYPIAHVVASPLARARETAALISQRVGRPVALHDGLREPHCGIYEGRFDDEAWTAMREMGQLWRDQANWERSLPEGESFLDLRARFVPVVQQFLRLAPALTGGVIFVGHGGIFREMLPFVIDNVDHDFSRAHTLGYAEFVRAEPVGDRLIAREWAGRPL